MTHEHKLWTESTLQAHSITLGACNIEVCDYLHFWMYDEGGNCIAHGSVDLEAAERFQDTLDNAIEKLKKRRHKMQAQPQ